MGREPARAQGHHQGHAGAPLTLRKGKGRDYGRVGYCCIRLAVSLHAASSAVAAAGTCTLTSRIHYQSPRSPDCHQLDLVCLEGCSTCHTQAFYGVLSSSRHEARRGHAFECMDARHTILQAVSSTCCFLPGVQPGGGRMGRAVAAGRHADVWARGAAAVRPVRRGCHHHRCGGQRTGHTEPANPVCTAGADVSQKQSRSGSLLCKVLSY